MRLVVAKRLAAFAARTSRLSRWPIWPATRRTSARDNKEASAPWRSTMRCSNFGGRTHWWDYVLCSTPNPTFAAGHSTPRRRCARSLAVTVARALSSSWPTKTLGRLGPLGQHGRLGKTSYFLLAAASGAANRRCPTLTSPPQVVSLSHTSGARPAASPLGVAGSFEFVVAVRRHVGFQRNRPQPADSCLRPRLIFLPLVAMARITRTPPPAGAVENQSLARPILVFLAR